MRAWSLTESFEHEIMFFFLYFFESESNTTKKGIHSFWTVYMSTHHMNRPTGCTRETFDFTALFKTENCLKHLAHWRSTQCVRYFRLFFFYSLLLFFDLLCHNSSAHSLRTKIWVMKVSTNEKKNFFFLRKKRRNK